MEKKQPPGLESNAGHSILKFCSLFENDFSLDWLIELCRLKASQVISVLDQAVENGILDKTRPVVYRFTLENRNTYRRQIDSAEKQRLHREIALMLIRELPDNEVKPVIVAEHLIHTTNDYNGCQLLMAAGQIHSRQFNTQKATRCFEQILNDLAKIRGYQEDLLFINAAMAYSDTNPIGSSPAITQSYLEEARQRANESGPQANQYLIEMHLAKFDRIQSEKGDEQSEHGFKYKKVIPKNNLAFNRFNKAYAKFEATRTAESINDPTVLNIYFKFWQGCYYEVINAYEKSLPDIPQIPVGHFPTLAAIVVGFCYTMVGQITQGLGMLNALRDHCLNTGNLYLASHASSSIAKALYQINHWEEAQRYLKLSMKEADNGKAARIKELSALMLVLIYRATSDNTNCLKFLGMISDNQSGIQGNLLLFPYLLEVCWAMENNELPFLPGFSIVTEIKRMLQLNNLFIRGLAYRYQALLAKKRGESGRKVISALSQSAEWIEKSGSQIELTRTYFELARHYLSNGYKKRAKIFIDRSVDILSGKELDLIADDLKPLIENWNPNRTIPSEIMRLTEQIASKKGDPKILQLIISTANRITGAERGVIYIIPDAKNRYQLQLRASKNFTAEQDKDPDFIESKKLLEKVIESGKGCITESNSIGKDHSSIANNIRSKICVPISLHGKIIGVLYHDNRLLSNVFIDSDLTLLSFFTNLIALELDRENAQKELSLLKVKKEEEIYQEPCFSIESGIPHGIIGSGPAYKSILNQIGEVAETDVAVLITGETGVGKNLVAGAIHRRSSRSEGPFITVQCSALTESLITSELFGHEKGAFTGATGRRIGRFELADSGTLFLDEIGDLSRDVQARLLRVLQNKEFERVGGAKTILTSNFRLITATNRDLRLEITDGRFRSDLFFRINIFHIHVPPLRERKEDIPYLINHFIRKHGNKHGSELKISQKDMERLVHYNWPGNVRELENTIQQALIKNKGKTLKVPALKPFPSSLSQVEGFCTLDGMIRKHIQEALVLSGGKVHGQGGAAEILNINPFTLHSKMRKLGIKIKSKGKGSFKTTIDQEHSSVI